MGSAARVASCLMRVSDLDRSVKFYCDVFACHITVHDPEAALLLTPDGFQFYLHMDKSWTTPGIGDLGVQRIMWAADSDTELQRIAERLRAHYPSTYTDSINGVTFVDGADPDGIRVLVACPNPDQLPREVIGARFR